MGFFFPYLLAIPSAVGIAMGGVGSWTGVFMIFGLNMALDEWLKDREISSGFWRRMLLRPGLAEMALWFSPLFLPVYLGFSLWKLQALHEGWEILGALLSTGIMMGIIAINAAHELVHRRSAFQRALGIWNLALVGFCWYRISHIDIHHRYVGTEKDPATARADEKVWPYWWRSFSGNLRLVTELEISKHGLFSVRNRLWHYLVFALSLAAVLGLSFGGWVAVVQWLVISAIAILLLKTVDYLEHKGLVRVLGPEGRFEPVRAQHSWDSYYLISNLMLFNLGFHANHHLKASLEFTNLGRTHGAMRMPYGYTRMFLRALFGIF
jgi:alkane 1-monooxygenase